jgi:hypothetical protein
VKQLALRIWGVWDIVYFHMNRMNYVSKKNNVFRVIHKTYKGPPLITNSGEWIREGDKVLKIHLHNYRLARELMQYSSDVGFVFYLHRLITESMIGLSAYIQQLPEDQQIKAVIGTSMLHKGADRFGFYVHDVESTFRLYLKGFLFKLIYLLMHPSGLKYLHRHGNRLQSKHLVMSARELCQLYGCRGGNHV